MSGITSGVGVFSGINSGQLINQLLAIDARPRTGAQRRIRELTTQQAATLDINTRLNSLRSIAQSFATSRTFLLAAASSSDANIISASATAGAVPGSYQFTVDRLASTQQAISRGFTDDRTSAVGLTSLRLESTLNKVTRDTPLAQLNGGTGIARGKIVVTDSSGASATVDLSRTATVGEALAAINNTSGLRITASVSGDGLRIQDGAGGSGSLRIADAAGYTTATSLGIAGTAGDTGSAGRINGTSINRIGSATGLAQLNDGRGVFISKSGGTASPDFKITSRSGVSFDIDIGEMFENRVPPGGSVAVLTKVKSAVTDVQGVIDRINDQAKTGATQVVRARLNTAGTGIDLEDLSTPAGGAPALTVAELGGNSTASDLGLIGSTPGATLSGRRLIANLNSVLTGSINGGRGLKDGNVLEVTNKNGDNYFVNLNTEGSINDLLAQITNETAGTVTATLQSNGTGITLSDISGGGGTFAVGGSGATSLGLAASGSTFATDDLKIGYLSQNTRLNQLPGGRSVTSGQFEITTSYGGRQTVNIPADATTLADIVRSINSSVSDVQASINETGDGLLIKERVRAAPGGGPGTAGGQRIIIRDLIGTAAKDLNLVGTAAAVGGSNFIDGTFDRTVSVDSGDTLQQTADKINAANGLASASIVSDGSSGRPFRLVLTARGAGSGGAFMASAGAFDLGLTETTAAQDARVFYGAGDPARALLLSSTNNTITGAATNLTVTLRAASATAVTVTVAPDTAGVTTAVQSFVDSFNSVIERIDSLTSFDRETQVKGTLFGNALVSQLRQSIFSTIQSGPVGITSRYTNLSQIGVTLDRQNKLKLDVGKLQSAIATDQTAVADLISARGANTVANQQTPVRDSSGAVIPGVFVSSGSSTTITRQGIAEKLAATIDRFIKPVDGLFTRGSKNFDDQIKAQNDRIRGIDARIERRRLVLQRQFANMEESIGRLQSQSGQLGNIRSI